jgi:hypothetical protein
MGEGGGGRGRGGGGGGEIKAVEFKVVERKCLQECFQ